MSKILIPGKSIAEFITTLASYGIVADDIHTINHTHYAAVNGHTVGIYKDNATHGILIKEDK